MLQSQSTKPHYLHCVVQATPKRQESCYNFNFLQWRNYIKWWLSPPLPHLMSTIFSIAFQTRSDPWICRLYNQGWQLKANFVINVPTWSLMFLYKILVVFFHHSHQVVLMSKWSASRDVINGNIRDNCRNEPIVLNRAFWLQLARLRSSKLNCLSKSPKISHLKKPCRNRRIIQPHGATNRGRSLSMWPWNRQRFISTWKLIPNTWDSLNILIRWNSK